MSELPVRPIHRDPFRLLVESVKEYAIYLLDREGRVATWNSDEFLATVSHELRTPLNAILGWTTILRRRDVTPDVDRALAVIERNARAQGRLIGSADAALRWRPRHLRRRHSRSCAVEHRTSS